MSRLPRRHGAPWRRTGRRTRTSRQHTQTSRRRTLCPTRYMVVPPSSCTSEPPAQILALPPAAGVRPPDPRAAPSYPEVLPASETCSDAGGEPRTRGAGPLPAAVDQLATARGSARAGEDQDDRTTAIAGRRSPRRRPRSQCRLGPRGAPMRTPREGVGGAEVWAARGSGHRWAGDSFLRPRAPAYSHSCLPEPPRRMSPRRGARGSVDCGGEVALWWEEYAATAMAGRRSLSSGPASLLARRGTRPSTRSSVPCSPATSPTSRSGSRAA
jgi:hypothetical protein